MKKKYVFYSESVWNDLEQFFNQGDLVNVHVLHNDYSQYYIDLESNMTFNL